MIAGYDDHATGSVIGDKVNSVVFDFGKIKRFVHDFKCEVDWVQGLRRSLAWFESHPEFQSIDYDTDKRWDTIISEYLNAFPK